MTAESDMLPSENILDLRLGNVEFDQKLINDVLNMKNAMPSAVQTFITLDFFNHATKHTDLSQGYEPEVNTVFSFKNAVDDFYMNFLQKESILCEIYIVKGTADNS